MDNNIRLVKFKSGKNEDIYIDARKVVAIESLKNEHNLKDSGTIIYLIAQENGFFVRENIESVKNRLFDA